MRNKHQDSHFNIKVIVTGLGIILTTDINVDLPLNFSQENTLLTNCLIKNNNVSQRRINRFTFQEERRSVLRRCKQGLVTSTPSKHDDAVRVLSYVRNLNNRNLSYVERSLITTDVQKNEAKKQPCMLSNLLCFFRAGVNQSLYKNNFRYLLLQQ